jgi:hypothetical protein
VIVRIRWARILLPLLTIVGYYDLAKAELLPLPFAERFPRFWDLVAETTTIIPTSVFWVAVFIIVSFEAEYRYSGQVRQGTRWVFFALITLFLCAGMATEVVTTLLAALAQNSSRIEALDNLASRTVARVDKLEKLTLDLQELSKAPVFDRAGRSGIRLITKLIKLENDQKSFDAALKTFTDASQQILSTMRQSGGVPIRPSALLTQQMWLQSAQQSLKTLAHEDFATEIDFEAFPHVKENAFYPVPDIDSIQGDAGKFAYRKAYDRYETALSTCQELTKRYEPEIIATRKALVALVDLMPPDSSR